MAFIINKISDKNGVTVTDTSQYLNQSVLTVTGSSRYTYAESFTLNILERVTYNKTITLVDYALEQHNFEDDIPIPNKSELLFKDDGLHQVTQLIIPDKDWIDSNKKYLNQYFSNIYYSDGNSIYDIDDNKVNIEDLIIDNSNIMKCSMYTFSIYLLTEEFKSECVNVLENHVKPLKRNILWIAIDVIKYCLQQGNYFEAERRLQQVIECLGLLIGSDLEKSKQQIRSCGCSHNNAYRNDTRSLYRGFIGLF